MLQSVDQVCRLGGHLAQDLLPPREGNMVVPDTKGKHSYDIKKEVMIMDMIKEDKYIVMERRTLTCSSVPRRR